MKYGYVNTEGEIKITHLPGPDFHPADEYDGLKRSACWDDEQFRQELKEKQRRFLSDRAA